MVVSFLFERRSKFPKNAAMFEIGDEENGVLVPIVLPDEMTPSMPSDQPSAPAS